MKTPLFAVSLLVCVAIAVAALAIFNQPSIAQDAGQASSVGPKWEYRALRITDTQPSGNRDRDLGARRSNSEETLNRLGAEGWELIAVRNEAGNTATPVFYFKRLKR